MRLLPQATADPKIGWGNGGVLGPDGGIGGSMGRRLTESETDRIAELEKKIATLSDQVSQLTTHVQNLSELPAHIQALLTARLGEA